MTREIRVGPTMMQTLSLVVVSVLLCVSVGCVRPQKFIDVTCGNMPGETLLDREAAIQCQQFKQDEAATAAYNEAGLLLKSYRACLEKYEQAPTRAREYCGQYGKALQDIGLKIKKSAETAPPTKNATGTPPKTKY